MPEFQKKVWQDKSTSELEIYKKKMEVYKEADSYLEFMDKKAENDLMKVRGEKAPKDPNKPKKPATAFLRFAKDFRKTHPTIGMIEASKAAASEWRELDDAGRKKYVDETAADKLEYEKLRSDYIKSEEYSEHQEKLKTFQKKRKSKLKKLMNSKS